LFFFEERFTKYIIDALEKLQEYEYSLCDTRKASTRELANTYLKQLLDCHKQKHGGILVALEDEKFCGFISYHFESEVTVYETDESIIIA
jgi:hypothetical protein